MKEGEEGWGEGGLGQMAKNLVLARRCACAFRILSMPLDLSDPNRVLSDANQIPTFNQRQRLSQAAMIQQPTDRPSNIEVIDTQMPRPARLQSNDGTRC